MGISSTFAIHALMALSATAALPSEARAEGSLAGAEVRAIGGGYELYFDEHLRVKKGGRSAPLTVGEYAPSSSHVVGVTPAAAAVTLGYMPTCVDVEVTYSHDQLEARLDHEEGAALLRKGKLAEAAKLLSRASLLDPAFDAAARDHAVALVKLRLPDQATAVLAPRFALNPMDGYLRLTLDRELAPLLKRPGLAHWRAAKPGTAKLTLSGTSLSLSSPVVRAPSGELAFIEPIGAQTACFSELQLVIRGGKGLGELTTMSLGGAGDHNGECEEKTSAFTPEGLRRIKANVAVANQVLAKLGFSAAAGEPMTKLDEGKDGTATMRFGTSGVSLVVSADGSARVLRGDKLVAQLPANAVPLPTSLTFSEAVLVADEQRVLFSMRGLGCYHDESRYMQAVSIR